MSEIQSISQNNYILQGTVATSAGIVGDGSTQNPLRADETVLYDSISGIAASGSTAQISEPLTNFNYIDVSIRGPYRPCPEIIRYAVDDANSYRGASFVIDGTQKHDWRFTFTADNTNNIINLTRSIVFHQGYNSTAITYNTPEVTGSIPCGLVKIVGINRINNA